MITLYDISRIITFYAINGFDDTFMHGFIAGLTQANIIDLNIADLLDECFGYTYAEKYADALHKYTFNF